MNKEQIQTITEYLPSNGIIYHLNNGKKLLLFENNFYQWDETDEYWDLSRGFLLVPTSSICYVESEDLEFDVHTLFDRRFIGDYHNLNKVRSK